MRVFVDKRACLGFAVGCKNELIAFLSGEAGTRGLNKLKA
jgi:hypothetical protein